MITVFLKKKIIRTMKLNRGPKQH